MFKTQKLVRDAGFKGMPHYSDPDIKLTDNQSLLLISTEHPLRSWGYTEVLKHNEGAPDFTRVKEGVAPFLFNHDRDKMLGHVTETYRYDDRAYAKVTWADTPLAKEKRELFRGNHLRGVSIGYNIDERSMEVREDDGEEMTAIAHDWELLEVSLVSVPADMRCKKVRGIDMETTPVVQVQDDDAIKQAREKERIRVKEILGVCREHNLKKEQADEWIENGTEVDVVYRHALTLLSREDQDTTPVAKPATPLGLDEREQKQFSVHKLLKYLERQAMGHIHTEAELKDVGLELEASREIKKQRGLTSTKGALIPVLDLRTRMYKQRAPYGKTPNSLGGYSIEEEVHGLIDILRNSMMVKKLGAKILSGLQGDYTSPRKITEGTTYWVAENGSPITESNFTLDQFVLRPKTVACLMTLGHLVRQQSTLDMENEIRKEMMYDTALAVDKAAISGAGGLEPTGIFNITGVQNLPIGTNGGPLTHTNITQLRTLTATANSRPDGKAYLTNETVRGVLEDSFVDSPGTGIPFWTPVNGGEMDYMGRVRGYRAGVSNQVPNNLTKGTGTDLSAMIWGRWPSLCYGEWGVYQILVDPFSKADTLQTRFVSYYLCDVNIEHPQEFAFMNDITTTGS